MALRATVVMMAFMVCIAIEEHIEEGICDVHKEEAESQAAKRVLIQQKVKTHPADQDDLLRAKYESCTRQVRLAKEVLARETNKMGHGGNGSVWAAVGVLQESLRALYDALVGTAPGDVGDRNLAAVVFMARTWAERANRTGEGNYLCALPEDHVMTSAQLRVEALASEVKEECNALLGRLSFKLLDSLSDLISEASVAIGCSSAGLAPVATEQDAAMLQQGSGLSFSLRSDISEAQTTRRLLHWVAQADYRLDYLEAMVPGSKAALARHFGQIPSSSLLQLSDSDFLERFSAFRESTSASVSGQHSSNKAEHPMRKGGDATRGYEIDPGWKPWDGVWSRRRRRERREAIRAVFKNENCPGTSESVLDDMFESPQVMDGCSSPLPLLFYDVVTPVCFSHDACYNCNHDSGHQGWCDFYFYKRLANECRRKWWWPIGDICENQAKVMGVAVMTAGSMHGSKAAGWCDNGCARNVFRYGYSHISKLDRWF